MTKTEKEKEEWVQQLQQEIQNLIDNKNTLYGITLNLLGCRRPSPSYPIFLWERFYLFQLKFFYENRMFLGNSTHTCLVVFHACDFDE